MIGVILWSDPSDKKAVIWCEDHGDLAFFSSPENTHLPDRFFEVGDMVEFDVSLRRNLRLAHNAKQLHASFGTSLKTALTPPDPSDAPPAGTSARIVPFQIPTAKKTASPPRTVRRRRG